MKKIYLFMLLLLALHSTHAQSTCATAVPIGTIPFSSGTLTTCGTGNDYVVGSYFTGNYGAGEDYVFSINITSAPVTYKLALGGSATWKIASVHSACPPTSANSIGGVVTSSLTTGQGQVTFSANGTYYIIVDTWPTPTCGEFTLDLSIPPPPPANDNASGAVALTVNSDYNCTTSTAGTTESATTSPEAAPTCSATGIDDDVWYSFVATSPAHRVSFSGVTAGTMVAALYSGTPGNLTFITAACASTTLNATGLTSGTTYYVRAYTTAATAVQTAFNICVGTQPPPPANDDAGGAVLLTVNADYACGATTVGTTVSATQSAEAAPTCSATGINDDVWFRFVATAAAHRISFSGVTTGTMVAAIYSGTPGSLAFVTGACASTTLNATGLAIGNTYYVRAYTSVATATTQTNFTICVGTALPPPANDVCSGAITLAVNTACSFQTFTTAGATDNDEVGDCTAGTEAAVWFKFDATQTYATITVDGAIGFDAVLGVLTGCGSAVVPTGGACIDITADGGVETRILSGLTIGQTYYIQVYDFQGDALTTSSFDICVVSEPCGTPTGVSVSPGSVTSSAASIAWTGTGSYILEYGLTGFTPGTGATAGTGGTVINPATSPQAITGLSSNTNYQVYVRQNCTSTGGGYSTNSTVVSFTTLCGATNVPYVQNFNGITPPAIPSCMVIENVNADVRTWRTITGLTSFPEITSNVIGYQYNTDGTTPANDWLFTQGLNLSTGINYTVSFRYLASSGPDFVEKLKLVMGASATSAAMTTGTLLFENQSVNSASFTTAVVPFTVPANGVYYFGFHAFSDADQDWLILDDINIDVTAACAAPLGVTVGSITATSASVSWTGTGNFVLEYGLSGFTPGTGATAGTGGTVINPATSPQTISGLTGGSAYQVYIRQDCTGSANGYSANSAAVAFSTSPINDECSGATTIGSTPTAGNISGGTMSLPVGACSGSGSSSDVWFQFTALSDGSAVVNVSAVAGFDAVVEVFGGTCGTLTAIDCEDANGTSAGETLPLNALVAGNTYFVRVYNYFGTVGTGTFNITVTGAALPISIEYFKGSKQSNGHLLDWKVTCYNSPSVTMILERSTDGRNFKPVTSQTETSLRCLQPFSFVDASPLAGINYYRLKSVDVDGKVTYSTVVALLNKEKGFEIVNLVPNPVSTDAVLSVTSANKSIIEIVVSDISGKQLNKQRVNLISGNNLLPLNVRNLPAGTYQVTGLTADGVSKTLRFVKQ